MNTLVRLLIPRLVCAMLLLWMALPELRAQSPASVVILANSRDPQSVELANYYASQRGIPTKNIIALPMTTDEAISWPVYVEQIHNPVFKALANGNWLNALENKRTDAVGRIRWDIFGNDIGYLVLCRGVPLRINGDAAQQTPAELEKLKQVLRHLFGQRRTDEEINAAAERFKTSTASVDAELALLAIGEDMPLLGPFPNILHNQPTPSLRAKQKIIKVTRLDGPTVAAAKGLVDSALAGEKYGLIGRAYIDQDGRMSEGYAMGNEWLGQIARSVRRLGYPLSLDTQQPTIPASARMDAPAIYFGWWTWNVDGPFALPGYRLPPGAIAVHLHSYSAQTLRKVAGEPDARWVGPLVAQGAACTLGNVEEPYLQFTHNFGTFFDALAEGKNFGDAAYAALPVLSWQAVAVGDPLYRPFLRTLDQQRNLGDDPELASRAQYIALRQWQLLADAGKDDEGAAIGRTAYFKHPGLALALKLARYYKGAGSADKARDILKLQMTRGFLSSDEWILAAEVAICMSNDLNEPKLALPLFRTLLEIRNLPDPVAIAILHEASSCAKAAGYPELEARWTERFRILTMPPPVAPATTATAEATPKK
ncbi:MAG: TIGR03790 family protein [Verrucomicrobiota bacterium]|nr:TIGR03790 family protein [Verrucomicrobiota bacterium]